MVSKNRSSRDFRLPFRLTGLPGRQYNIEDRFHLNEDSDRLPSEGALAVYNWQPATDK